MAAYPNISAQRVKYFQSLKLKKYRQKYGQFVVEGTKSVLELLHSDMLVEEIAGTLQWLEEFETPSKGIRTLVATKDQLHRMTALKTAPPVMAVVKIPEKKEVQDTNWILGLDGIRDPGNLGTIIRIADWYGISDIVCSEDTVELFNQKVLTSTMGSFTRVNVHYLDLNRFIESYKHQVLACVMTGKPVYEIRADKGMILIGSESHGISDNLLALSSERITIPSVGKAESLNAAVATGIICDRLIGHP